MSEFEMRIRLIMKLNDYGSYLSTV